MSMDPFPHYWLGQKIDSLFDDEFESLVSSLSRATLKTYILQGLSLEQGQSLNVNVNNILEARFRWIARAGNTKNDAVSSMTDDRQPIKLDNLPILPLSKISSFLTLTDQRNFERTNRSIFVRYTCLVFQIYFHMCSIL